MYKKKIHFSLAVLVVLAYSAISIFFIRTSKNIVDTTCESALVDYLHLPLNEVLRLDSDHNAKLVSQWFGWYKPESWGTWSSGDSSFLYLNIDKTADTDTCLVIGGWSVLSKKHPENRVKVFVGRSVVGNFTQNLENPNATGYVRIPHSAVTAAPNGNLVLKLQSLDPTSPASALGAPDTRVLGFGIASLQLVQCSP
jgi:hypothetical protein